MLVTVPVKIDDIDGAKVRIEAKISEVIGQIPVGAIKIGEVQKVWSGNTMGFKFKVSKGIFYTTIKGTATVAPTQVAIDVQLSDLVKKYVSEDQVGKALTDEIEGLFPRS
jgi:hypothetical protein